MEKIKKIKTPCMHRIPENELNIHIEKCLNCQIILSVWHLDGMELLKAIEWYGKKDFYVLYSGGKDSAVLSRWAHNVAKPAGINIKGCVAVDTGIATPDWRPFVENACKEQGWNLTIVSPKKSYEDFCYKFGFPHAGGHTYVMRWLKLFPLRDFEKEHRDDNIVYLSGIRSLESQRRFGNVQPLSIDGRIWGVAPIHNWSDDQVWEYFKKHDLPRSPAYAHLNLSGDCNCGAFGNPMEFFIYEAVYPQIANRIKCIAETIKDMPHIKDEFKTWGNPIKKDKSRKTRPAIENAICSECTYRV